MQTFSFIHSKARSRRRGTVLVLVVAMLSMLFVIGVTFLNTVTFEAGAIDGAKQAQRQDEIVDGLLREVKSELRAGFLGDDFKAWNGDAISAIANDTYGEIAGVHPLIASIEPSDVNGDGSDFMFFSTSDLELTLADTPQSSALDDTDNLNPGSAAFLVHVNFPLNVAPADLGENPLFPDIRPYNDDETLESGTILVDPDGALLDSPPLSVTRRDADGDGVWDSYSYKLPDDRFPRAFRGDLADQLRDDSIDEILDEDDTYDPDAIYYSLRVIPHGGMIDVGYAHPTMLGVLPDFAISTTPEPPLVCLPGSYVPEGEEINLRRRFLLPPRNFPLSQLQNPIRSDCANASGGQIPMTLYDSFVSGIFDGALATQVGDIDHRWSPIDTGENGDLDGNPSMSEVQRQWISWVDPLNTSGTEEYDFRHLVTTVNHDDNLMRLGQGSMGNDWIDEIAAGATQPGITDWPVLNGAGPLNGRLKVSLPGLMSEVLAPNGNPTSIDDLIINYRTGDPEYDRFVGTIQDAFMLMLRNVPDVDGDDSPDADDLPLRKAAAALTANLIDFVDQNTIPTRILLRDPVTGALDTANEDFAAYGYERQPFITEIFLDSGDGSFLVELYNPDRNDAVGTADMNQMSFRVVSGGSEEDFPLPVGAINADDWAVYGVNGGGAAVSGTFRNMSSQSFMFAPGDTIQLIRTVPLIGAEIVLDEMQAPTGDPSARERFTSNVANQAWFASIGGGMENPTTSLGDHMASGTATGFPVELVTVDTGDIATALPTTGTLLLLSRYANQGPDGDGPITVQLANAPANMSIDVGRMPVFDQMQLADSMLAPAALNIPWGQLVFDYFTAVPHNHSPFDGVPSSTQEWISANQPFVDQNGLRVHGRLDINAAPWSVLAGLPLMPLECFGDYPNGPGSVGDKIIASAGLAAGAAQPIGPDLAQSIVAYREAREVTGATGNTADYSTGRLRAGTGFLGVGELANVRNSGGGSSSAPVQYDIDSGNLGLPTVAQDYIRAVAKLVALGDWVTNRSHVFTIYGTLRGAGRKSGVDQKAIRFQETVDRLPIVVNGGGLPRRVGPRVVGSYAQADRN